MSSLPMSLSWPAPNGDAFQRENERRPTIGEIEIANNVGSVTLECSVVYMGAQALSIDGNRATLTSDAAIELFRSTGGADLELRSLDLEGGHRGVVVAIPAEAAGTVSFRYEDSTIQDQGGYGILIDDQGNILELVGDRPRCSRSFAADQGSWVSETGSSRTLPTAK